MRDIIIFLDMDPLGSTPQFLEAARSLRLKPILLSTTPWLYRDVPAANAIRMRKMTVGSVTAAIDRLGRERVAGVFTPRSWRAELAARVAQVIGRPHSDPQAIAVCHHKLEMRRLLESKGFSDVAYQNVTAAEEAYSFAKSMGGNSVLKPHTSTGSAGVRVCKTAEEARRYAEVLLRKNPRGVLIEEFIQGPFFAVDAFHGKVIGIRRLLLSDNLSPIVIGDEAPAREPLRVHQSLTEHSEAALELIGYTRGAAHVQAVYARNKPYLIEINPRLPAGAVSSVKAGFGIDMAQLCLRFACGLPDPINAPNSQNPTQYVVTNCLLRINEPIRELRGIEDASRVPYVVEVGVLPTLFGQPGRGSSPQIATVRSVAGTPELATESAITGLNMLTQVPESSMRFWLRKGRDKLVRRFTYGKAV